MTEGAADSPVPPAQPLQRIPNQLKYSKNGNLPGILLRNKTDRTKINHKIHKMHERDFCVFRVFRV
jgi:hypothetical protein